MQNEKRKALLEHESAKLKDCDEALHREMREWKAMLVPRKQVSLLALNQLISSPSFISLMKNVMI